MLEWKNWDGRGTYVLDSNAPGRLYARLCHVCVSRLDTDIMQPCNGCGVYTHRSCAVHLIAWTADGIPHQAFRCYLCSRTD